MELVFIEPAYTVAQRRTILTKAVDETQRLDIIAYPIDPKFRKPIEIDRITTTLVTVKPDGLEEWGSAVQMVRNLAGATKLPPEVWALYSEEILHKLGNEFPDILEIAGQLFFCPIISDEGVGYREGFVIGWMKKTLSTLRHTWQAGTSKFSWNYRITASTSTADSWETFSYVSIDRGTEDYWNVVAGDNFLNAMETLAEFEVLEPDPKFPGAEHAKNLH